MVTVLGHAIVELDLLPLKESGGNESGLQRGRLVKG